MVHSRATAISVFPLHRGADPVFLEWGVGWFHDWTYILHLFAYMQLLLTIWIISVIFNELARLKIKELFTLFALLPHRHPKMGPFNAILSTNPRLSNITILEEPLKNWCFLRKLLSSIHIKQIEWVCPWQEKGFDSISIAQSLRSLSPSGPVLK